MAFCALQVRPGSIDKLPGCSLAAASSVGALSARHVYALAGEPPPHRAARRADPPGQVVRGDPRRSPRSATAGGASCLLTRTRRSKWADRSNACLRGATPLHTSVEGWVESLALAHHAALWGLRQSSGSTETRSTSLSLAASNRWSRSRDSLTRGGRARDRTCPSIAANPLRLQAPAGDIHPPPVR